jgi:hypothetical protein
VVKLLLKALGPSQMQLKQKKETQSPKTAINQPVKPGLITNKQKEAVIAAIDSNF